MINYKKNVNGYLWRYIANVLYYILCRRSELFMVKNVYLGFFDKFNLLQSSHGFTYWWIYFFSAHCKHVPCNTLAHSTNEDLLYLKLKGDTKSRTLSRTSDTTEIQNLCVIKVILIACSTYIFFYHYFLSFPCNKSSLFLYN